MGSGSEFFRVSSSDGNSIAAVWSLLWAVYVLGFLKRGVGFQIALFPVAEMLRSQEISGVDEVKEKKNIAPHKVCILGSRSTDLMSHSYRLLVQVRHLLTEL